MKYLCLVDQLQVQLLKGKLRIRPRLSGEAEGPVPSGVKGNKGQGLLRAARKFPGAPPGFAFMVGYPAASVSLAAKSIRSSPMAVTSYMVNSPLCGRF